MSITVSSTFLPGECRDERIASPGTARPQKFYKVRRGSSLDGGFVVERLVVDCLRSNRSGLSGVVCCLVFPRQRAAPQDGTGLQLLSKCRAFRLVKISQVAGGGGWVPWLCQEGVGLIACLLRAKPWLLGCAWCSGGAQGDAGQHCRRPFPLRHRCPPRSRFSIALVWAHAWPGGPCGCREGSGRAPRKPQPRNRCI